MTGLTMAHLEILERRGLDPETLVRHGVESCARTDGDWISIPYVVDHRVVNHKYRTITGEKRFYQDAGADKHFWNVDCLRDSTLGGQSLIVTEGEFDAVIAIQNGYARTVSVPDGAPAEAIGDNPESVKYAFVQNDRSVLAEVREIILCTDGDQPGINLMNDLALRLGKERCKFVRYPKGCKDLNDAFVQYGAKGVTETIRRAQWCKTDDFYRMSELPPAQERQSLSIFTDGFDDHYKIRPKDFTVVTGIPSHGKSSWINHVSGKMARHYGWTTCFASFEQEPQTDHRRALRTWFHQRRVINQTAEQRAEADHWIDQHFSFIVPSDEAEVTLPWVLDRARASIIQHNAKLIVIDPWNEMDHDRPRDMSLTEYTGYAIKEFKRLAKRFNVHVMVAAHPAKQYRNDDGGYHIPSLYDISDSAHWYNKPDAGLVVWRGEMKGVEKTIIRIAKSRAHDQIGKPGDVEVTFNSETFHYEWADMS